MLQRTIEMGAWSAVAMLTLTAAACGSDDEACSGAPNNSCALLDAAASGCTSSAECAAPTAVCDEGGTNTCVACTTAEADACSGTTPVCGPDNACQACTTHAECSVSNVCLPTGACADAATVAYVAPTGSGTTCTQAAPCNKLTAALLTDRPYVKMTGTINDRVAISDQAVTVLADPGAVLTDTANGILMTIERASQVAVYDLTIRDASGAGGSGIVLAAANTSTLRLERVTVIGNAGAGIMASGGTITVTRSTIAENGGGGLEIGAGTAFTITNNVIANNGVATGGNASAVGGALLVPNTAGSRFEWNTVVFNKSDGSLYRAGVTCAGALVQAAGNLVFANTEQLTTSDLTQTSGGCMFGNTVAIASSANNLGFADPLGTTPDFHLTAATPTTILNAGGACTGVDLDGDARPQGGACDLGADELVP